MFIHDQIAGFLVRYLTAELPNLQRQVPFEMERLKSHLHPCDVVLVEGKTRISRLIMYVTQSSWSHAAMYIGDALLRWGGPDADKAIERFGPDAAHLVLESDMREGVRVVPLAWYGNNNLRICRPHGLRSEDRERVLSEMLKHMGYRYDRRNILDLARYLLPFHLIPARWRRKPLYLGSSTSREVICSALIAKAFYKVNYPIQPIVDLPSQGTPRKKLSFKARARVRHPSYIMPRDFDLSANFDVLKVHLLGGERFGYGEGF
jgi:Permuted papain-like amidase enzyme, YaeF/YiiX, C92 family